MAAFFIGLINSCLKAVGTGLAWVIALFPDTPFGTPSPSPSSVYIAWITWFIPFPTMLAHLVLLLTAILIFYAVRVAARWLKTVKS